MLLYAAEVVVLLAGWVDSNNSDQARAEGGKADVVFLRNASHSTARRIAVWPPRRARR